eukprot:4502779-Pyramimonas_sp.AAC.1
MPGHSSVFADGANVWKAFPGFVSDADAFWVGGSKATVGERKRRPGCGAVRSADVYAQLRVC